MVLVKKVPILNNLDQFLTEEFRVSQKNETFFTKIMPCCDRV